MQHLGRIGTKKRKTVKRGLFDKNIEQLVEKQLAENSAAENSSQAQKIISAEHSTNFVIVVCYEVLNYYKCYTVNYKCETFQASIKNFTHHIRNISP